MTITTPRAKSPVKNDPDCKVKVKKIRTILKKRNIRRKSPKQEQHLKFAGPIKILIIEPKSEYCRTVWCAIGVGLTHMCVGATNYGVLHYSLETGNTHATVCCFAFHFLSAEAILSLNYANGWSTPMRQRHRKLTHAFLQLCGASCAIVGTVLAIIDKGITSKLHGLTGLIAAILAGISVISGLIALLGRKTWLVSFHMTLGLTTFLVASISLCTGILYKPFKDWAGGTMIYILMGIVIFYTLFIVCSSFLKCLSRL